MNLQTLLGQNSPLRNLSAKFVCRLLFGNAIVAFVLFEFFYFANRHDATRNLLVFPSFNFTSVEEQLKPSDENCYCNGELFCFPGVNSDANVEFGRPFPCTNELHSVLVRNRLLEENIRETTKHYEILDAETWTPVFVTSVSADHFAEIRTLMRQLRKFYPKNQVLVFDLGLNEENVSGLVLLLILLFWLVEIKRWCNVEVNKFDFVRYPPHVRHLRNFAFKLVLLDALKLHSAFFYFDTSVLVQNSDLNNFLRAVQRGVLMPFSTETFTYHSVFAATNPKMYEFLPVPPVAAQIEMVQSTAMLVIDSPYTRRVMKWWTLCALSPDCLLPEGSNVDCLIGNYRDRWHTYMKCHRYDQSFWNLYAIAELYGPKRMAVRLNYTTDFKKIDLNLAKTIERNRNRALNPMFKRLIKIKRGNPYNQSLNLACDVK